MGSAMRFEKRAVDLSAPAFIQANAKRGLKYYAEGLGGDGLVPATIAAAREIAAGRVSENKVRKMAPWFARHKADGQAPKNSNPSDSQYPGAGLVAWLLWGGDSNFSDRAQDWAQRKIDALDAEADARSKMAKKIERRTYKVRNVETRKEEDGKMRLSGYAALFNEESVPLPYREVIAPGAFRKTLSETPDVRLLINHEGLPLARTKNDTLVLTEDDIGLKFEAELPETTEARDLYTLIQRGDVDQMSFAFRVIRQKYNEDRTQRTLVEVGLEGGDVSVVTYPAYEKTNVEAREQLRAALQALKDGRDISPEAMLLLQSVFSDMTEGHELIMKAVEVMTEFLSQEESAKMGYNEEDEEDDMRAVSEVGAFVSWDASGGTARGKIERVVREGELNVPDSDFTITAEEDDPAVLIQLYRPLRDGYVATTTRVGHKASTLTRIDALPEPSPEEDSRKISLRLAQAIVSNIK